MCLHGNVHGSTVLVEVRRGHWTPIAGVRSDCELLTVMLETKLRSAAKTANILNC